MARAKTGQKARVSAKQASVAPIANKKAVKAEAEAEKPKKPVELQAYTIPQFCEAHGISIDTYFRMQRTGTGPVIKKIGQSTRISVEAARAWREAGKAETQKEHPAREAGGAAEGMPR